MKFIQIILFLALSFLMGACNDNKEDELPLVIDTLKQTQWSGTLYRDGKIFEVGLVFYTDTEGQYSLKYLEPTPYEKPFIYLVDGKLLVLDTGDPDMTGNWLLAKRTKKTMTLELGTGGKGAKYAKLSLTKKI